MVTFDIIKSKVVEEHKRDTESILDRIYRYYLKKNIEYNTLKYTESINFETKIRLLMLLIEKRALNMFVSVIIGKNSLYPSELKIDDVTLEKEYKIQVEKYTREEMGIDSSSEPEEDNE